MFRLFISIHLLLVPASVGAQSLDTSRALLQFPANVDPLIHLKNECSSELVVMERSDNMQGFCCANPDFGGIIQFQGNSAVVAKAPKKEVFNDPPC